MKQQILIIDSGKEKNNFLIKLFQSLVKHDYWFLLWSNNPLFVQKFQDNNWPSVKNSFGWPQKNKGFLFSGYYSLIYFLKLFFTKQNKKIKKIICFHYPEKIIITPLAKFFHLPIIWLELPNFNIENLPTKIKEKYIQQSQFAQVVCFESLSKQRLVSAGMKEEYIFLVRPGINLQDYLYQENIFDNLAQAQPKTRKKFTIGTVVNLNKQQYIEMLLQALEICLGIDSEVQLIIIGLGEQRKKIQWLIKKMRLENNVWLVSDQVNLKKWFSSFDLFVVADRHPDLDDLEVILGAMANKLVVIGPSQLGLDDLSFQNQSLILIKFENQETLSQQIIAILQNPKLRQQVGVNASAVVKKYFSFLESKTKFLDILEKSN